MTDDQPTHAAEAACKQALQWGVLTRHVREREGKVLTQQVLRARAKWHGRTKTHLSIVDAPRLTAHWLTSETLVIGGTAGRVTMKCLVICLWSLTTLKELIVAGVRTQANARSFQWNSVWGEEDKNVWEQRVWPFHRKQWVLSRSPSLTERRIKSWFSTVPNIQCFDLRQVSLNFLQICQRFTKLWKSSQCRSARIYVGRLLRIMQDIEMNFIPLLWHREHALFIAFDIQMSINITEKIASYM